MRTPTRLIVALAAVAGPALYGANTASAQSINLSACSSLTVTGSTLTCVPTGGNNNPGATAPACSVIVSPSSGAAGTAVSVSASCSGNPTTYSWTGGFMQGAAVGTGSGSLSATQTFTVTASNSAGSTTASGTFTLQQSTGGGGGNTGGGVGNCSSFGSTVTVPVQSGVRAFSSGSGAFGNGTALVAQFTTGSRTGFGRIATVEFNGQPTPRTAVLAASACDFGVQQYAGSTQVAMAPTIVFSVGPNAYGYPQLSPNTTYYLNIENKNNGSDSCASGDCPMSIDLVLP